MRAVGGVRTDQSFSGREEGVVRWRIHEQCGRTGSPRALETVARCESATQGWGSVNNQQKL